MVLRHVFVHQLRARGHEGAEPAIGSADHDELKRVGGTRSPWLLVASGILIEIDSFEKIVSQPC